MKYAARLLTCLSLISLPVMAVDKPDLWLYYATNLQVDKNIDQIEKIWSRAAKAGYTHVMLTDSKFAKLGDMGSMEKHYFANIERTKKIAADLKLEIVPALFDVGYSNNMLWHDPNLAEGLPVQDQPFVVKGDQAAPSPQADIALKGKFGFKDDNVEVAGGIATVKDNTNNARFNFRRAVPPFRCYRITVSIKTDHYTGQPQVAVLDGGGTKRSLQHQNLGVKRDQEWTVHQVIFNSLDSSSVNIYFGVWGAAKGTLQWKDWSIEEVGLLNVLRRPGAPCVVKLADGTVLTEAKDYSPIADPHLGNTPYNGEYEVRHAPPTIKILDRARLPDGTKLLVSWFHPAIIYDGQVSSCITEPKTLELLADQSKRMRAAWGAAGYMMQFDEFRCCNWDESCRRHGHTPGELLADNARFCTKLLDGSEAYTWNDMFDPFHNAVKGPYYLVKGEWLNSWEGLDKRVIIVNWNHGHRDESLKFFADRGHRQIIAGYYDGNPAKSARDWLDSAAKVKGVVGIMYTTWRNNFSDIEAFANACRGN